MMVDGYDGAVEDDRAKAYAVHKGLFADLGDGRGERNRLERRAAVEDPIAQTHDGDAVVERDCLERQAVLKDGAGGEVGDVRGDGQVHDTRVHVHTLGEGLEAAEVRHVGQTHAILEEVRTNGCEIGISVGKGYGGEGRAACEGRVANVRHAFGNVNGLEGYASVEGVVTDLLDGGGNDDRGQKLGVSEGIGGDLRDVGGSGDLKGLELGAREGTAQNLVNRVGKDVGVGGVGGGIVDQGEARLVKQRAILISEGFVVGIHREGGHARAAGEGIARKSGQGGGQVDGLQGDTVREGHLPDGLETRGQVDALQSRTASEGLRANGGQFTRYLGGLEACAAVEGLGTDGGHTLQGDRGNGGVAEGIVTDRGDGGGQINRGQGGGTVKDTRGNGGHAAAVSEHDGMQSRAAREGTLSDGANLGRNGDALEADTVLEGVGTDGGDGGGNVDVLQHAVVDEQAGGNAGEGVGQVNLGEADTATEDVSAQRGESVTENNGLEVYTVAEEACAHVGQHTVGAEVHALQSGASREGEITDGGDRVGDGDGGQTDAITEGTGGNGLQTLADGHVLQGGAGHEDLIGQGDRAGDGQSGHLGTGVECLVADGGYSVGNIQAGDSGSVEGLIADALQLVTLKGDGAQLGGSVRVEGVITDGLQGGGENDHLQRAVAEGGVLDVLQRGGKLDETALELVEGTDLNGLNPLGDLQNALILNVGGAVVEDLTVGAVEDTELILLHLGAALGQGHRLNGFAVLEDGIVTREEGGHAAGQLHGLEDGVVLEQTRAHHSHGVSDLEAGQSGMGKDAVSEVSDLTVTPIEGGQIGTTVEGTVLNDGDTVGNREFGDHASVEAVGADQGHGGIGGKGQGRQIAVAAEGVGTHILDSGKIQGFESVVAADGVILEADGGGILVELNDELSGRLGGAVLRLAGLIQVVHGEAVDRIQMGGQLDVDQIGGGTDGRADGGVGRCVGGVGIEGADGQQRLAVLLVGLGVLLEHDGGQLGTVEGSRAHHVYVLGNGQIAGLGSGTVDQKQLIGTRDRTEVENTADALVDTVSRMDVDGVQNRVALENGVHGVVVVGLVVGTQLGEVRGQSHNGELTAREGAVGDLQGGGGRAVGEVDRGQGNRLEGVDTDVGDGAGEGNGGQRRILKGRVADDRQTAAEVDGGQSGAALEGAHADLLQLTRGDRDRLQGGGVGEGIGTDELQVGGQSHRGQLGSLEDTVAGKSVGGTDGQGSRAAHEGQGGQLGAREGTVTDVGDRGGNDHGGQTGACKGSRADGGQSIGQGKGGDGGVVEGLGADRGGGCGQGGGLQLGAAVEGLCANGQRLFVGGIVADRGQSGTAVERALADLNDVGAELDRGDALVVLEDGRADLLELVPGQLGQIAVQVLGVVEDLGQTLDVQHAVLGLEVGVGGIHLNALQGETVVEDRAVKGGQSLGQADGLEDQTAAEDTVSEGYGRLTLTKGEGQKLGAVLEGGVADVRGALVNHEGLKTRTLLKGIVTNADEGGGVGNFNRGKKSIVLEGVLTESGHVHTLAHAEGGQSGTSLEGGITNSDLTSGLGGRSAEFHQLQGGAVLECAGADAQSAVAGALHRKGDEAVAVREGVRTDAVDVSGNDNRGNAVVAFEDVGTDAADARGGYELTANRLRNVENGQTGRAGVTEEVLHGGVYRAALLHQNGVQGRERAENRHVGVKGGDARGQLQHGDVGQSVEGLGMDGHVGLTARGELNGLQGGALVEGVLGDRGDRLGNDDLGDPCVVEGVGTDGVYRLGKGVGTRLGSGEDLQVAVARALIKVEQSAVVGAVEYLVVPVLGLVDLEGLHRTAAVEGTDTDMADGIGHGDGLQLRAILEGVVGKLGDRHTLISGGNTDLGHGSHLGACLDRVGAVGQKLVGQHVGGGVKEGVDVEILGEGVGSQAHALVVGNGHTLAVGFGVPALEEADVIRNGVGNGEGEALVEEDDLVRAVLGGVSGLGIHVEDDLVLVGLPVGEKHHGGRAVEYGIGEFLAVALSAVGYVVPAVQGKAGQQEVSGQGHGVADGQILGDLTAVGAAHVGNGVGVDLHGDPLVVDQIDATHLNDVQACLGQHDLGGAYAGYGQRLTAVDTHLVVGAADNGSPVDRVGGVGQGGNHLVVAHRNGGTVRGGLTVLDGADRNGVDLADGHLQALGFGQIEGGSVYGEGLVPHLDLVGGGAAVSPGHRCVGNGQLLGNGGSGLLAGGGGGLGREVALGNRGHRDGDIARIVAQREVKIHDLAEGLGLLTDRDLHGVVNGVHDGIPDEGIGGLVVGQTRHALQSPLVAEGLGDRLGVPLGHGGDGEENTALLHGAVAEVVVGGAAVVQIRVIVAGVSALDGDEVTLGVLDRVEDQGAVNDRKGGHGIQSLVAEVANGGVGAVLGLVGHGRDLYRVVTGGELREVDVLGGGAHGLLVENGSVGGGDLQSVGGGTHHGIPLHRGGGDADLGGGKLGALGSPDGVEGHVGGQNGFRGELGGQLVPVAVHAGEPAVEYVALTGRDRQEVELTAHGRLIGQSLGTLVAKHEADGILGRAGDLFGPAGVEHGVGLNESGVEVEGGLQLLVGIPAQENTAVLDGVGGLGSRSAVDHVSVLHHAAAVGVVADGEADLLAEGHDGLAKGQD